jgi:hypothetical protein
MHPLLARPLADIARLTADMTTADLDCHPPGKWSSAGTLEHLARTFEGTRRNFQKCLDTGTRRATRPTLRRRAGVLIVIELGRFPTGVQAPGPTLPKGIPADSVMDVLKRNLAGMDAAMAECETRFGRRAWIANHSVLGPLTLRQWRQFHRVHARHHLKQIASLRAEASFHGSP